MLGFKKQKLDELIVDKIQKEHLFKRYVTLFIGCTLLAIAFNLFFLPENIVYGGVSGIAIVTKKLFNITPSTMILVLSLILLVISYFTLGWSKTKGSIAGSILFPICVSLTANIGQAINFDIDNTLLLIIFGSVVAGVGSGINFKSGFTTGGTDIINQIISKYAHVSIGNAMLMSDGIIVIMAGFFLGPLGTFQFEKVMYAIIVLYIISIMADKVILGISQSKSFYIVTEKESEIKEFLIHYLNHGVTVLDGRGGYSGEKQKVIMCIVPTKEYFIVKEAIHKIDNNAFFLVTDTYEISGGQ